MKVTKETKKRITALGLATKGKTFDIIINELVSYYEKHEKKYSKDYKEWEKNNKAWETGHEDWKKRTAEHKKELKEYAKRMKTWNHLIKWARSKGFKG